MRVLLWHGYLLTGSGSNVYTANHARALRADGHDVVVMCQEKQAGELPFVDAAGDLSADNLSYETQETGAEPASGRCTVLCPDIGRLLPLYVYDDYEGFQAKRFVDLSDAELENYVQRNVDALTTVLQDIKPDVVVVGHEVMGPFIASLASKKTGCRYAAKLHGSALEYAVKEQPGRYLRYATEGLGSADVVIGGSEYMVREAASVVPGWKDRAVVVNPGCDTELFKPMDREEHTLPVVGFVGKLMPEKGIQNFIAALGLTSTHLDAVIVGFGSFEEDARELVNALEDGDLFRAKKIARNGSDPFLGALYAFLSEEAANDTAYWQRLRDVAIGFTGRLDHGPLSQLLPTFDLLVVPSVVPEAFGMVAAEAAACGVLPVVPNHSGIAEAGAAVEEAVGRPGLLTFDAQEPIRSLAEAIDRVLALPVEERRRMGAAAAELAAQRWSWPRVARRVLEIASRAGCGG